MATDRFEVRAAGVASRRDALKLAGPAQIGPEQAGPGGGIVTNRFSFEIDGVLVAGVHSVEGIESDSDVVETRSGTGGPEQFSPGDYHAGKMVVTKDWSNTSEFFTWRKSVLDGKTDRKSISVIFFNDAGQTAGRLNFFHCWPSKWTGPAFNARNSAHATESLEIVWETIELKAG